MTSAKINILVLNPNSSRDMTEGMRKAIGHVSESQGFTNCIFNYQTAPVTSPASINNDADLALSTDAVLTALGDLSSLDYDAILVGCYSVHPLVVRLKEGVNDGVVVLGIFEASVLSAFSLLEPYADNTKFGVVTTGEFWEKNLADGVGEYLGLGAGHQTARFAGIFTSGLEAGDFHGSMPQDVVGDKLRDATRRLLRSGKVRVVIMGCAGMAGLEDIIRSVVTEEYGDKEKVYVVDGVKAGAGLVLETVRSARLFG